MELAKKRRKSVVGFNVVLDASGLLLRFLGGVSCCLVCTCDKLPVKKNLSKPWEGFFTSNALDMELDELVCRRGLLRFNISSTDENWIGRVDRSVQLRGIQLSIVSGPLPSGR